MTLTQLRYFCDVAETKNFTASSKRLFVAQSSISFAIRELENDLGVPLFIRGKTIELTSYGKQFLPYVQSCINSLDNGIEGINQARKVVENVKIGVFVNTTYYLIPWFLKDFSKHYPNSGIKMNFQVQYSSWVDMFEPMVQGEYDMIITGCEEPKPNTTSLQIAIQPMRLLVHCDDPRFEGVEKVSFEDLVDVNIVCVHKNSYMDQYFRRMYKARCNAAPEMMYVPDLASLRSAVILQQGVGLTTTIPVDNTYTKMIDIDEPEAIRRIYLSWPTNRELSENAAIVRDYFIEVTENHSFSELSF